jgi:glucose-1-phosphate cytidylyltransferase
MKAVILAGGFGTRISEETHLKPKPMVEIGGKPILWHIMKIYSAYGINDFIICLGYKGYVIKEYFANYFLHMSDVTFDLAQNQMLVHNHQCEPWRVTLVDTGEHTMTGGRLKRVASYLDEEDFCFTYGDGVCDINIQNLVAFHREHRVLATLTAVQPPGRFGALDMDQSRVLSFEEKPPGDNSWVSGGFFVLSPKVIDYIEGDQTPWEREPLESIAADRQLCAYKYRGFWYAMDALRDKNYLEDLWNSGRAPWKVWPDKWNQESNNAITQASIQK